MQITRAADVFGCLSSPLRFGLFRLLVRHGRSGLMAGEIATALAVPPNNLSFRLKALTHAGLLGVQQERYRANLPLMLELVGFQHSECCSAEGGDCAVPDPQPICADIDIATSR